MNQTVTVNQTEIITSSSEPYIQGLRAFFTGLLIPCGFAPFHMPGLAILGIAVLFIQINQLTIKQSFSTGFLFGLGFFGLGISWVYTSIHNFGHLNILASASLTFLFIAYLALYPGIMMLLYKKLALNRSLLSKCSLFSALWCLSEFLRSTFLSGFPWLLLGTGQIDTPLKYLLPIIGIFGVGFITCFAGTILGAGMQDIRTKRYKWMIVFISIILTPSVLKNQQWSIVSPSSISTGIIQANLSMRDKWDEALFWQIMQRYQGYVKQLLGKTELIVMPESAIPVPLNYVSDFLENLNQDAKQTDSAILLGIPEPTSTDDSAYYNSMTTLGLAKGSYQKQHLVPFGEFIPHPFQHLSDWLNVPMANMKPGKHHQPLILIKNHPIASLICYEVAYPQLLRKQLPQAEWIVSISDDGWFGHSFAIYQQLQMAQVLSLQTGRFQVVANNDGLSSIINTEGDVVDSLPAFSSGVLSSSIQPATGKTPWVVMGDTPILLISLSIFLTALMGLSRKRKKSS